MLTKEERERIDHGNAYDAQDDSYADMPSMVCGFSQLLHCAIQEKNENALKKLLDCGLKFVQMLKEYLGEQASGFEMLKVSEFASLSDIGLFENKRYLVSKAILPYVNDCSQIINEDLRRKAEKINILLESIFIQKRI